MAQLTWQNVGFDPPGRGNQSLLGDGAYDPLQEALAAYQKKKEDARSTRGVEKALSYQDPYEYMDAVRRGEFRGLITKDNQEIIRNRPTDIQQLRSNELSQQNTISTTEFNQQQTAKSKDDMVSEALNRHVIDYTQKLKEQKDAAAPAFADLMTEVHNRTASGDMAGAIALLGTDDAQKIMDDYQLDPGERAKLAESLPDIAKKALDDKAGIAESQYKVDSLPQTLAAKALQDAAKRTSDVNQAQSLALTSGEQLVTDDDKTNGRLLLERVLTSNQAGSVESMLDALSKPEYKKVFTLGAIKNARASIAALADDPDFKKDPRMVLGKLLQQGRAIPGNNTDYLNAPDVGGRVSGQELTRMIDLGENGGRGETDSSVYDTTFNFSNMPGNTWDQAHVQGKTLAQLYKFSTGKDLTDEDVKNLMAGKESKITDGATPGSYGAWVAQQDGSGGVFATPMGRWGITMTTALHAASRLKMDPRTTVFGPENQNKIMRFLVNEAVGTHKTPKQIAASMKTTWAGLKDFSDEQVLKAVSDFQKGGMGGITEAQDNLLPSRGPEAQYRSGPLDPYTSPGGDVALDAFQDYSQKGVLPPTNVLNSIYNYETGLSEYATDTANKLAADDIFDGQSAGLLDWFSKPEVKTMLAQDAVTKIAEKYPEVDKVKLQQVLDSVRAKTGIDPGYVAGMMIASPGTTGWVYRMFNGGVTRPAMYEENVMGIVNKFFDTTPGVSSEQKIKGLMEQMKIASSKTSSLKSMTDTGAEVDKAGTAYFSAVAKQQENPEIDISKEAARYAVALKQHKAAIERTRADPRNTSRLLTGGNAAEQNAPPGGPAPAPPVPTPSATVRRPAEPPAAVPVVDPRINPHSIWPEWLQRLSN